ncbi:MAG: hypothetical protein V1721_08460 [Pseudomonadota bacterium]
MKKYLLLSLLFLTGCASTPEEVLKSGNHFNYGSSGVLVGKK